MILVICALVYVKTVNGAWCSSADSNSCLGKPLHFSKLPTYLGPFPMGFAAPTALDWYGNSSLGLLVGVGSSKAFQAGLRYFEREENGSLSS